MPQVADKLNLQPQPETQKGVAPEDVFVSVGRHVSVSSVVNLWILLGGNGVGLVFRVHHHPNGFLLIIPSNSMGGTHIKVQ